MTAKDLHFSFDSALAQAQAPASAEPGHPATGGRDSLSLASTRAARTRANSAGDASARRAWITASLVSLINMAFLVLAALWLTGNTYQVTGFAGAIAPGRDEGSGPAVAELQAGLKDTDRQLAELRAALAAQSDLLLAIKAQLASAAADRAEAEAGERPEVAAPAPPPAEDKAAAAANWHINLGSFATAEAATALLKKLNSMGYAAQVGRPDDAGEINYRVWLGGYDNRAAAEVVAKQLMDKTSLTGLWVWNGD